MRMENELDINTLIWVKSEIDETLNQARKALEAYTEDEDDASQIQFCLNYLHQVRGTLQMVELYGSAMAAEEMENLVQALINNKVSNRNDAFEVLIRGILQLPDYLEHLREGKSDTPILLMPLLNDLRAARGAPLLSENALFSPDLSINAPLSEAIPGNISELARKLRHHYHLGLLGWFKDKNSDTSLQKIATVIEKLRNAASEQEINRLLWVVGGLVESLLQGGLNSSVSVKLLLGQVDRQLKKIIDRGEHALNMEPPSELLKNLLYYVATSRSGGKRTIELKEAFKLNEILPDVQTLEQARADLAAPNTALMSTVSGVLMEDLLKVKDNLDLFVRAEERDVADLEPLKTTLSQMADTLGMLGLGIQREHVQSLVRTMEKMLDGSQPIEDRSLMEMAGLLLELESSLSEASAAREANVEIEAGREDVAASRMQTAEQQKLLKTVIGEAKVELEHIKDAVNLFSKNPADNTPLETVPAALDRIKGGIAILNLERAADLLNGCIIYIRKSLLEKRIIPSTESLDHLADAISSVEYYLESLAGRWGQPDIILDVAEHSLHQLQADASNEINDDLITLSELKQPDLSTIDETKDDNEDDEGDTLVDIDISETDDEIESLDKNDQTITETLKIPLDMEVPESVDEDEPTLTLDIEGFDSADDIDSEIVETEIEAGIDTHAELAEARLTDPEPEESEKIEVEPVAEAEMAQAQEIKPDAETMTEAETETAAETVPVEKNEQQSNVSAISEIDDEIIEIFLEEGEEELQRIGEELQKWKEDNSNEAALKEIRRSFHTLKGSGRLVGALDIGEFAWAFENMLNRVIDHTIEVSAPMFEILEQSRTALPKLVELFKQGAKPSADILILVDHADNLSKGNSIEIAEPESEATEVEGETKLDELIEDPIDETMELDEPVIEPEAASVPVPEIDPVLLEIYRKEVEMHLATLRQYCQDWKEEIDQSASHPLIRALHTLKGSSRTTGVKPIAELCGDFEHYINEVHHRDARVPFEAVSLLVDTADYVASTIALLDQPDAMISSNQTYLEILHSLLQDVDQLPRLEKVQEPTDVEEAIAVTEAEIAEEDVEYDEDLLEIFIEEGEEILDSTDSTLHHWFSNPDDQGDMEAMQRYLHTLKGGARMAGVVPIGDLSHQIESMLTDIAEGKRQVNTDIFNVLQKSQDHLVRLLEQLKARQALSPVADMMAEVNAVLAGESVKVEAEISPATEMVEEEPTSAENPSPVDEDEAEEAEQETEEDSSPVVTADVIALHQDVEAEAEIEDEPQPESSDEKARLTQELESTAASLASLADEIGKIPEPIEEPTDTDADEAAEADSDITSSEDETNAVAEVKKDKRHAPRVQEDQIRVKADLLDSLVNFAGEVSIYRARMEQQTNSFSINLDELEATVSRLREQLRQFEIETETQIQFRHEETTSAHEDFDPLEFDRFTHMQHLSRAMMESLADLDSLRNILANINRESETLLLQQSRVNTELQEGLMRTRLVPFTGQVAKFRRIIRQTSDELGKKIELHLEGLENELDRTVMDKVVPSLEHMLRNSVAHGIETPAQRLSTGKAETGNIHLSFAREGSDIIIRIQDDGAGINFDAIQKKAIERGMIRSDAKVSDDILLNMIMEAGFSTAEEITQISGRGVGMDVVNSAIKQLGGVVDIQTEKGKGTTFVISLPLTLAISRALMVSIGEDNFAIPLLSFQGVERVSTEELNEMLAQENPVYEWIGENYKVMTLGQMIGLQETTAMPEGKKLPLLMFRSGDYHAAIQVDALLGSREIVVKPVGPQLSGLRGVAGATIMGDGSVMLILDLGSLVRQTLSKELRNEVSEKIKKRPTIMVVDDSITVRKVTTRLLERHDYEVMAAKDGVDALSQLHDSQPDVVLLDVEMPRMDGFELATNMRNDETLKSIPIIMITSRTGEKHRERAKNIGVNMYMGKPFNEDELLKNIRSFVD